MDNEDAKQQNKVVFSVLFEDLPFEEIVRSKEYFSKTIKEKLNAERIEYERIKYYFTRNRYSYILDNISKKQKDVHKEVWGPPKDLCYQGAEPTKALMSFCEKNSIHCTKVLFKKRNDREYAHASVKVKGENSLNILSQINKSTLLQMPFFKKMNLDGIQDFSRPIRRVLFLENDRVVPFEIFDISSSRYTLIRHFTKDLKVNNAHTFIKTLKNKGIMHDPEKRRSVIIKFIQDNCYDEISNERLEYLTYLSESPKILVGEFPQKYGKLPEFLIDTTCWNHQKCVVLKKNKKITNKYLSVIDCFSDTSVVTPGYNAVMVSRLKDASFFLENDLSKTPEQFFEKLKKVVYFENWGTLELLTIFLEKISVYLSKKFSLDPDIMKKAAHFSKIDLTSEVISEKTYTSLQGIMGAYYLKTAGHKKEVFEAVRDQYMPAGENDDVPDTVYGAILSICDKIMLISIAHKLKINVSGSKDILGIRRASIGIYRIILKFGLSFDFLDCLEGTHFGLSKRKDIDLTDENKKDIYSFILERIRSYEKETGNDTEIVEAVVSSNERDLLMINKKINTLSKFSKTKEFQSTKITLKRVMNILEGTEYNFNESILCEKHEKTLYSEYKKFSDISKNNWGDFDLIFKSILDLKVYIDAFFDNIMVNVEDEKIKNNRKGLLLLIGRELLKIANFKIIS